MSESAPESDESHADEANSREHSDGENGTEVAETRLSPSGWRGRARANAFGSQRSSPLIIPPGQIGSLGGQSNDESSSESTTDQPKGGPRVHSVGEDGSVREHSSFGHSDGDSRSDIARLLHGQYGTQRDVYESLGYPTDRELDFTSFLAQYRRHPYAKSIVDKPALDTFQDPPAVVDHGRDEYRDQIEDESEEQTKDVDAEEVGYGDIGGGSEPGHREPVTPFEQGVKRLFDGDTLRRSLTHRLTTADRANRLGSYSAIFIGLRDDRDPEDRIDMQTLESVREDDAPTTAAEQLDLDYGDDQGVEADGTGDDDPTTDGELSVDDRLARLSYISVYDEDHSDFDLVDDHTSQRNRLPEEYYFDPENDGDDFSAHYSRVVHVTESTLTDDLRSDSVLRVIYNNLEDTLRIAGGSAESLWMGAFPGLVVNPPTVETPNGPMPAQFEDGGEELAEQISNWRHTMERAFFPNGGEVDTIDPVVAEPTEHMDVQINMLAAGASPTIPRKLLIGNQSGDRASTEDRKTYRENIRSRRTNYAGPRLVRVVLDRLIALGVLAEPEGGGYELDWPPQDEPTSGEQAATRVDTARSLKLAADAIAAGINPHVAYDALGLPKSAEAADQFDIGPIAGGPIPADESPIGDSDSDDAASTSGPAAAGAETADGGTGINENDSEVQEQFNRL